MHANKNKEAGASWVVASSQLPADFTSVLIVSDHLNVISSFAAESASLPTADPSNISHEALKRLSIKP